MGWIYVGILAEVLLLTSIATLIVAWRILRAVRRSERAGDERLEILREQQQRLAFLNEERRQLLQELERQRQEVDEQRRRLALPQPAPPEATGAVPGTEQPRSPRHRAAPLQLVAYVVRKLRNLRSPYG